MTAAPAGRPGRWLGLSLLIAALTLAACGGLLPTPAPPTPTPLLLAHAAGSEEPQPRPATPIAASPAAARPTVAARPASPTPPPTAAASPTAARPTAAARLMAVGRRASIVLRADPAATAAVVARLDGSAVLWVEGSTPDGRWLWVSYGDAGAHAWAAAADVQVFGDLAAVAQEAAAAAPPAAAPQDVPRPTATAAARLPGKIAFQTAAGGDIYVMDATGANLRRVTYGLDPALSPDGAQLAFARWDAPHGVFVIDLATGVERRIASADRPRSPTWQANAATLVFAQVSRDVTCRQTPFGCLTDEALRRQFGGHDCVSSPFGQYCIGDFPVTQISETGLVQAAVQGEGRLDLPALNDAQSPAWHPQRAEVLYRGGGGLQITAPDGVTRLLVSDASINSPAWSPDGSRIAVQVQLHDHTDIFLLDAAGNRLARLTAPASAIGAAADNVAPAWSPDGRYLAFLSNRDGAWRLYRMNADGSDQVPLAPAALAGLALRYDFAAERAVSWSR